MRTDAMPSVMRMVDRFSAVSAQRASKPSPQESLKGLVWVQMGYEKQCSVGDRLFLSEDDSPRSRHSS